MARIFSITWNLEQIFSKKTKMNEETKHDVSQILQISIAQFFNKSNINK